MIEPSTREVLLTAKVTCQYDTASLPAQKPQPISFKVTTQQIVGAMEIVQLAGYDLDFSLLLRKSEDPASPEYKMGIQVPIGEGRYSNLRIDREGASTLRLDVRSFSQEFLGLASSLQEKNVVLRATLYKENVQQE